MGAHFEVKQADGGKFLFRLKAGNNEIVLTSELYSSRTSARDGIEAVKRNAGRDSAFARRTSRAGEPYFVLIAVNGEPIGTSEMYSSTAAMESGIEVVKREAPRARAD